MANTRQSAKRARQNVKRAARNQSIVTATRSVSKKASTYIASSTEKPLDDVRKAYEAAVRALGQAASKGAIPKERASRKISRLTLALKKKLPAALTPTV